jgi:hypothetical protein
MEGMLGMLAGSLGGLAPAAGRGPGFLRQGVQREGAETTPSTRPNS